MHCRPIGRGIDAAMVVAVFSLTAVASAQSSHWPQFRGPDARGIAPEANLPEQWSATENIAWKTDIRGRGWSSPVVWSDRVFLTTVVNLGESEDPKKGLYFGGNRPEPPEAVHQWKVFCLDLETGRVLWDRQVHEGRPDSAIHLKNSYASETPVTDGRAVYCAFGNVGLFAFDLEGNPLWQRRIEPRDMRHGWGTAASPVLHADRLYYVNDNDEESYLLCLDTSNGEELWRIPRDEKSNWATPYVWENELRTEIVTAGTGQVRSYDLSGELLWTLTGMSSITIGTPYAADGLLYVTSGYVLDPLRPIYAIRPGAEGDITLAEDETSNEFIAWADRQAGPYNPTTLVYEGRLYTLLDRGFLTCHNARDGTEIYGKQRIADGRAFTASPWAARGRIYCLNEDGVTFVFQAGDEYKLLATNPLAEDDMALATPAIAGDRLLIRTAGRLYCVREESNR